MSEKPVTACKRCRLKKLRCDDEPKVCRNCSKAGVPCMHVDSRSRREYPRGYIEELLAKIEHLKTTLGYSRSTARDHLGSPLSSPAQAYRGDGSVASMARLVEAAVSTPTGSVTLPNIGIDVTAYQEDVASTSTVASLPSLEAAHHLFDSYLNGLHLLHPFLHRATLIHELSEVYAQHETMPVPAMFRVNMVFAIGAVSLVRAGLHDVSPVSYYAAAMKHAGATMGLSDLEHIQALLLILIFSLQHDIGIGSKWDLARVAMRICVENGFHRKGAKSCNAMRAQMQRRVFWACYISDRHSSSVLGVPTALQDEHIDVELPIDADDDLIECGMIDGQFLRGPSEVSAQLRQIHLRQITSKITTDLYRTTSGRRYTDLQTATSRILGELDAWRQTFPLVLHPRNIYESPDWRDLNYFRERLKCFRLLMLAKKDQATDDFLSSLDRCREAASQIAGLYQSVRTSEKLIMNWTCVHDMMSAGFTNLYCGIAQRDVGRDVDGPGSNVRSTSIQQTSAAVIDTLLYISGKWPSVKKHVHVFKELASRVDNSMTQTLPAQRGEVATSAGEETHLVAASGWDPAFDHHADLWDAAMVAFLDQPFDLGNIDWGAVDWEAMELLNEEG